MTNQHRATDEQWAETEKLALRPGLIVSPCLLELRDRIQQLEATQQPDPYAGRPSNMTDAQRKAAAPAPSPQHAHPPSPAADKILALQDQIRDGALSLADAVKEIGAPAPGQPFTAKYLFTAGNIQQDSFYYAEWDSNSVLFDIANLEMGDGCLTPGDNIKIAHRWGEPPASGVYSTINYKIASVSETEGRAWTIRAARVSSAPQPDPAADARCTRSNGRGQPMTNPPPLTPEQQLLLTQYQQATNTYWQAHDVYAQAADALGKNRRACLAAGFSPTSYLGPHA